MHENGWLSGSIYLNIPQTRSGNEGNLALCLEEQRLVGAKNYREHIVRVETGILCLFPASMLHWTIPFDSNENRTVLAFDIRPRHSPAAQ